MQKILVFGSSLASGLESYDTQRNYFLKGYSVEFLYSSHRGKSYEFFIDKPKTFDEILNCNPDYIVVIFGGNSISTEVPKSVVLKNCRIFYQQLYDRAILINPNVKIIATSLPMRYVYNYSHNTPIPDEYKKLRNYVNQRIKSLTCKHFVLNICGPNNLDNVEYYKADGVHFNYLGKKRFFQIILDKIEYILPD